MKLLSSNSKVSLLFIILVIVFNPIAIIKAGLTSPKDLYYLSDNCAECIGDYIEEDYVELTTFPVNLSLLFWEDQPSVQAAYLNSIGNGTWGWMLTPWGGHFISSHFEGADKWYFYCNRPLEMVAPVAGSVDYYRVNDGTEQNINGTDCLVDVRLELKIGNKCEVKFQHLTIPVSLHEQVKDGRHNFEEGDFLGYPTEWSPGFWTIDFHYAYNGVDICPYPALSDELKTEVVSLYNRQYEKAKLAGVYPESQLCNNFNISIADTLWGVWEYEDGPFNSFFNNADRLFGYSAGGLTILSRDLCNPDTFWRDFNNPNKNLTSEHIGMFVDGHSNPLPGYDFLGDSMLKLAEGDYQEGILEIITTSYWDWGFNTSIFAKFSLDIRGNQISDDRLTIEYFTTLGEAQTGFTDEAITYKRFLGFYTTGDMIWIFTTLGIGSTFLIGSIILTIVFIRRRKRKKQ